MTRSIIDRRKFIEWRNSVTELNERRRRNNNNNSWILLIGITTEFSMNKGHWIITLEYTSVQHTHRDNWVMNVLVDFFLSHWECSERCNFHNLITNDFRWNNNEDSLISYFCSMMYWRQEVRIYGYVNSFHLLIAKGNCSNEYLPLQI